jgi:8-oxo-dGTP pyrophosphatase MutT (NUDIX family)
MTYESFHVTQGAIIKNMAGAVLILGLENGVWILPGGHVDRGEDWLVSLKRELKEEIGLEQFTVKKVVDIAAMPDGDHSLYLLTFLIEPIDFKEPKLSNEHEKYAWVTLDTLDKYNFWHEILKNRVRRGLNDEHI